MLFKTAVAALVIGIMKTHLKYCCLNIITHITFLFGSVSQLLPQERSANILTCKVTPFSIIGFNFPFLFFRVFVWICKLCIYYIACFSIYNCQFISVLFVGY